MIVSSSPALADPGEIGPASPIERLVEVRRRNEGLLVRLAALRIKIDRARADLARPGCDALAGRASLDRLRDARSGTIAQLVGNRRSDRGSTDRVLPDPIDGAGILDGFRREDL